MLTVNLDKARHDLGTSAAGRTDYRVFVSLAEYMDAQGVSTVSQNVISGETGYARRTVSNSIHRLAEKGFLTIEKDTTGYRGIASNIYHINRKYLSETQTVADKRDSKQKPQCAACVKPCGSKTNEMQSLARIGEIAADVIKEIFALYEEKESK